MKGKAIRKSLALALTMALAVTILPISAFAEETEGEIFLQEDDSEVILQDEVLEDNEDIAFDEEIDVYDIEESEESLEAEEAQEFEEDDAEVIDYTLGETVNDTVPKYEYKIFGFSLKKAGRVNIHTVSGGNYWILATEALSGYDYEYYIDEKKFWQFPTDQTTYKGTDDNHVDLIPGDYYLYVIGGAYADDVVKFSFTMTFDEIVVNKDEVAIFDETLSGSNNNEEEALKIKVDQKYVAQSHSFFLQDSVAPKDWYVFTLDKESRIFLTATNEQIDQLNFRFYNYDTKKRSASLISTQPYPLELLAGYYFSEEQVCERGESMFGPGKDTIFPKGTYAMSVEKIRDAESKYSVGNTGEYRFKLSTKSAVPVESITIQRNGSAVASIKIPLNKTAELTAVVKPEKATEKGVVWSSDDTKVAEVHNGVVTPKSIGECTITATTIGLNKEKEALQAICKVEVTEEKTQAEIPIVIAKQKVDVSGEYFFNEPTDKTDKFVVLPKGMGSVSKGKFTGKKAGTVTITKKIKEGKKYVEADTITVEVEVPVVQYPEKAKTFTYYAPVEDIPLDDMIVCEKSGEIPVRYVCSDKKGKKFELGTDGRTLNIKASGKCKVTAYYSDGKEAAYTINFTAKLPKLSKSKISLKKGKSVTVKISNVPEGITPIWSVVEYDATSETFVETEYIGAEVVEGSDGRKCKVWGIEKTGDSPVFLLAEVDGFYYFSAVYVK